MLWVHRSLLVVQSTYVPVRLTRGRRCLSSCGCRCRPKSKAGDLNSILLMKRLKAFPPPLVPLLLLRGCWDWRATGLAVPGPVPGAGAGAAAPVGDRANAAGGSGVGDLDLARAAFLPSAGGGDGERETLRKDGIDDICWPPPPAANGYGVDGRGCLVQ